MWGRHQYIERASGRVCEERPFADRLVRWMYNPVREYTPALFKALTSARFCSWLGNINYDLDLPLWQKFNARRHIQWLTRLGVNLDECTVPAAALDTPRKIFERRIRYAECRAMDADPSKLAAPADSRMLCGSLEQNGSIHLKNKFFDLVELLGMERQRWCTCFSDADFAVFRLTPEKYHYNHVPVSGVIRDQYEIHGQYHACNPGAVVAQVTPFSKNRRLVTIIDTDVNAGSRMGLVAMVEVVALMIGDLHPCYTSTPGGYAPAAAQVAGTFLRRGQPKSLFRPGSSTVVLLFEPKRVRFSEDILLNQQRADIHTRFGVGFGAPLVETEVDVRSTIGTAI
ncbi:MAG: phosphatidylserine decarboxylase [Geobacteraceae bacterium]|nr:phosphatidylserine decarboxylase [Geobacteraceae bacterium]